MEMINEYSADERWVLVNSTELNSVETQENGRGEEEKEEDDNDEALSLCDLPLIHHSRKESEEHSSPLRANETDHHHQEDFDFCSLSKESEMCAADEIFYQGQILPLRRSIRRSESMDHCFSSGLISSRSSSISSHHSSTSGSGSSTATDPKLRPRNPFHSHPSPSPKIQFPSNRINSRNCTKKSTAWNVFRLGLVTGPPEIAIHDLKTRFNSKNPSSDRKKIKPWDYLGGCKCSVDAVDTVPSEVVIIKRSASDGVRQMRDVQAEEESTLLAMKSPKKRWSHRRTFEWLKQLTLEGTADEP